MKTRILALLLLVGVIAAPVVAFASVPIPDGGTPVVVAPTSAVASAPPIVAPLNVDDPVQVGSRLYRALIAGDWKWVAVAAVVLVVYVFRRLLVPRMKQLAWFSTRRGGAVLALSTAMILAVVMAVGDSAKVSWSLVANALMIGFAAGGGWTMIRELLGITSTPSTPAPTAPGGK